MRVKGRRDHQRNLLSSNSVFRTVWRKCVLILLCYCYLQQIGGAFIKELISEFGTNHIYNTDTFNEMTPRSSDPAYLSNASKAVYEGILAGDPDAVWLMQGWLFLDTAFWQPPQVKALLQGIM